MERVATSQYYTRTDNHAGVNGTRGNTALELIQCVCTGVRYVHVCAYEDLFDLMNNY